jgi:hypothetical protein
MNDLEFADANIISLKNHPQFNEDWLQAKIADNPQILGLGELELIERERRHKSGRLDILLADFQSYKRFEIEIMLGQTDESHIIRCIEYWDIERRRYPQYDHCAVLVAEDITSRFLNVLALFNGQIPMIIIQLNALQVDNKIILNFVKVMDKFALRKDDEVEVKITETNRDYWDRRATKKTVSVVDKLLPIINNKVASTQKLNFNKYYIGLTDGLKSRNFIYFKPKKQFTHVFFEIDNINEWIEKLDDRGISSTTQNKHLQVTLTPSQMTKHEELINELIDEAVERYNGD